MAATALVQTRIDPEIRDRAQVVLESVGMTVSDAVRVLLTRVANEGALPFAPASNAAHDAWFRAKVQEALDDPRPGLSERDAKTRMAAHRAKIFKRMKKE
jgi:DNA-damage-inducible protein J